VGQRWPRASQEACWGSGRPKDSDAGARVCQERRTSCTYSLHHELRRLGFGGAGELGGARRTAGFKSVGEAEFSCTRIVSSEVQTLIPASGEGRGTHSAVVKSEGDFGLAHGQFEDSRRHGAGDQRRIAVRSRHSGLGWEPGKS
jgi:hypothetical protein